MGISGDADKARLLRSIPSVEAILRHGDVESHTQRMSRSVLRDAVRAVVEVLRDDIRAGRWTGLDADIFSEIIKRVRATIVQAESPSLVPVINATGVIIHTNLGRAPLADEAITALARVSQGYSNLEYDLIEGGRGRRELHGERLIMELLGCQAALVVNNNAAAVLLVLNTVAEGGEVIVSRGELVEIGGSFRIPDIMAKSGAILREVGTTNRTRLQDYKHAINERTRLLLRVHRSNFQLVGFTERPGLDDLVALGQQFGLPCYEDLGSGCLSEGDVNELGNEPTVRESLAMGVDVCSFSGDKLLGGPQAGVILGSSRLIEQMHDNPLMRALRPDKLTYAALESTLRLYRAGMGKQRIPVHVMLSCSRDQIRRRAQQFVRKARRVCGERIHLALKPGFSLVGGGAAPDLRLDTVLVGIQVPNLSATESEVALRSFTPPIISRIEDDQVVLDLRTVSVQEEPALLAALQSLCMNTPIRD